VKIGDTPVCDLFLQPHASGRLSVAYRVDAGPTSQALPIEGDLHANDPTGTRGVRHGGRPMNPAPGWPRPSGVQRLLPDDDAPCAPQEPGATDFDRHASGDEDDADLGGRDIGDDDAPTAPTRQRFDSARDRPAAQRSADDEQLAAWIASIIDQDERALAALYDATFTRVYGVVHRIVRRAALAEEVVEDTYFQVWRQAVRFDASRGLALTWLLSMARSRAIDALRREARFQHDTLDDEQVESTIDHRHDAQGADDLLAAARNHADLHRALMLLGAQPRQLVSLAFFRGLSHEEIASQTALPLGTVKSQIRRALMSLRQILGEAGMVNLAT
jgi:RNA polymerase sigma-70 factor (ECF subfamily)